MPVAPTVSSGNFARGTPPASASPFGERAQKPLRSCKSTAWTRKADSGNALTFQFCPICGSTVYWTGEGFPGFVAVAIGTFADPDFPAPTIAVWEEARHPWVLLPPDVPPKRAPKQG